MHQTPPVRDNYLQAVLLRSVLVVTLLAVVCVGGCTIVLYPNQAPQPDPERLLLTESNFPQGWTVGDVFTYRVEEDTLVSYDGAIVWSYAKEPSQTQQSSPTGIQTVYSYTSFFEAHLDFVWQSQAWFDSKEYADWQTPKDINAPSTITDEYKFACGVKVSSRNKICVIVARYGQYLSIFQIQPEDTNLSNPALQNVLTAIDQRFIEMGVK